MFPKYFIVLINFATIEAVQLVSSDLFMAERSRHALVGETHSNLDLKSADKFKVCIIDVRHRNHVLQLRIACTSNIKTVSLSACAYILHFAWGKC